MTGVRSHSLDGPRSYSLDTMLHSLLGSRAFLRVYAAFAFFTLLAGDAWRYSLTWWGFSAIAAVISVISVLLLVHYRDRWRLGGLPLGLLGFVALAALSIIWSFYPGATALGFASTLLTVITAVALAVTLNREELLRSLGVVLRIILGLSIVFELFVSLVLRAPLLPWWTDTSGYDSDNLPKLLYWSRDLILDGGKIQGIVGNSSLLGFISLLGVIVFGLQLAQRFVRPSSSSTSPIPVATAPQPRAALLGTVVRALWLALAFFVMYLTRSATITIGLVAVIAVLVVVLLLRAATTRRARGAIWGLVVAVLVGIPVVVNLFSSQILGLLGKSNDLTGRLGIWETVIDMAQQRPVFGWGWVSYWVPWVDPFDHLVFHAGVIQLHAHNAWLDIWMQLGFVGVVVFGTLVAGALVRSWWLAVDRPQRVPGEPGRYNVPSLLPLLLLVALLVQSLAESRLIVEYGLALLVICAVSTKLSRHTTAQLPGPMDAAAAHPLDPPWVPHRHHH